MSWLSGSTRKLPQPGPKIAGLDENKTSTAEQARPVPWLCGRQRIGVTFLSQAFDQITEEVKEEVSKKDDEITTGYNYFCSFAALLCGGAVDTLEKIYLDEKEVWSGLLTRGVDGTAFVDVTIEGTGDLRLYWGTTTQTIDPTLLTLAATNQNNVIEFHPAYRGFCYAVFKRFFLGYQRTNVPNIEFAVGRYPVVDDLPNSVGSDCNLAAAVADALTDGRMGLGLSSTIYDATSFSAVGATLEAEDVGVSPFVSRRQPFRQVLLELCETTDAFHLGTAGGAMALGLVRPNSTIAGNSISEDSLAEVPRITIPGYESTSNQAQLVFTNATRGWKEDVATGDDLGNLQIVQEPRSVTLQRPWVTKPETAFTMAYAAARTLAQPEITGVLVIRKSRLGSIEVGKVFKFSYAQWGICHLYVRCTELHWPDPLRPIVEVSFRTESGRLNGEFTTPNLPENPEPIVGHPVPFVYQAILELPPLPETPTDPQIGWLQFLAARPNYQTSRFKAHFERAPDSFEAVHTQNHFAWRAVVDQTFNGDGTTVDQGTWIKLFVISLETDLPVTTLDEACRNRLILWVGPSVAPSASQFISLFDVEIDPSEVPDGSLVVGREYVVVGGVGVNHASVVRYAGERFVAVNSYYTKVLGTEQVRNTAMYRARTIRGRFDTKPAAVAGGTAVWVVAKSAVEPYHIASEAEAQVYKLQPFVYGEGLPLDEAVELPVTIVRRALRPWRPANVRAFGTRKAPFFTSGQSVSITWDVSAAERGAFFASFGAGYTENLPSTKLSFIPADGVGTEFSVTLAPGVASYSVSNASIVSNFGSEKSFRIAAYHMRNNLLSLQAEELLVSLGAP